MNVVVIPARGGSKRIPRKNIKTFNGKPMIAWSIEAALESNCFDRVIVSTDDQEIAEVARSHGAEIPFIRPAELSGDFVGTTQVMKHAIEWLQREGHSVDKACCLYATAPFVRARDLSTSLEMLKMHSCDYVFSVTTYPFPIQRALRINGNGSLEMFQPSHVNSRSQDLEEAYHDAGQFYWGQSIAWIDSKIIFGQDSHPYILPRHRVQDIDTPEDWIRAEWLFRAMDIANT